LIKKKFQDTVERFPLSLVREPTAFTSTDPKELYNNILIYAVGHPPSESPIPAEMHIFQVSIS
jgi:epidermal growth factor receptor kinase substrate 8